MATLQRPGNLGLNDGVGAGGAEPQRDTLVAPLCGKASLAR
jgi:hypothetical protein